MEIDLRIVRCGILVWQIVVANKISLCLSRWSFSGSVYTFLFNWSPPKPCSRVRMLYSCFLVICGWRHTWLTKILCYPLLKEHREKNRDLWAWRSAVKTEVTPLSSSHLQDIRAFSRRWCFRIEAELTSRKLYGLLEVFLLFLESKKEGNVPRAVQRGLSQTCRKS